MRAFYGGQINDSMRGNLAVVISREKPAIGKEPYSNYEVFLESVHSREFIHMTGVRAVDHPLDRVYIGVSPRIGDEIARRVHSHSKGELDLYGIDNLVVQPYFLDKHLPKPQRIVLESTRDGYKIVEQA